jgi:hypothetical protein
MTQGQQPWQVAWQYRDSSLVKGLQPQLALSSASLLDWQAVAKAFKQQPQLLVFVPIFNAPMELNACLKSLLRQPAGISQVILLDDGSTDPAVAALLQPYKLHPWFQCFRHSKRSGLAACWQRALQVIKSRGQDGVLLHPQWQVSVGLLTQLRLAAYARAAGVAEVATVSAYQDLRLPLSPANALQKRQQQQLVARVMALTAAAPQQIAPTEPSGCWYICHAAVERVMAVKDAATLPDISYFIQASIQQGWCHLQSDQAVIWPTGRQPSRYRPLAPFAKRQPTRHQQWSPLKVDEPPHSQSRSDVSLALSAVFNQQDFNHRYQARRMLLVPAAETTQSLHQYLLARQRAILAADPDAEAEDWLLFLPTATKLTLSWIQVDTLAIALEQPAQFTTMVLAEHDCIQHDNTTITHAMEAVLLQWLAQWCVETVDVRCCHLAGKTLASTRAWVLLCQQWCQRLAIKFVAETVPSASDALLPVSDACN